MILTDKQIAEIAANLEFGMRCFYNLKTGVIKEVPDFTNWAGMDEESWDDEFEEIDGNREDYFEFEGKDSHNDFKIMADFADTMMMKNCRILCIMH